MVSEEIATKNIIIPMIRVIRKPKMVKTGRTKTKNLITAERVLKNPEMGKIRSVFVGLYLRL